MYCAVVGVSDPVWQQRIVAVIECGQGKTLTLAALQEHCRTLIAGYKIPRALVQVPFKLTENGKIDYRWALELATVEAAVSAPTSTHQVAPC
jgi:acyl-CoA synthetase (AMP-forming)/AMP-acid ligase II